MDLRPVLRRLRRPRSASRILLEAALPDSLADIPHGFVIDFGSKHSPYAAQARRSSAAFWSVDIRPDAAPDLVADVCALPFRDGVVSGAIFTEVLEHISDPAAAVNELRRVAASPSRTVASTRFLYHFHPDPDDFFRYTHSGLTRLFRAFDRVEVRPLGTKLHAIWDLIVGPSIVRRAFLAPVTWLLLRVGAEGSDNPSGFLVIAETV